MGVAVVAAGVARGAGGVRRVGTARCVDVLRRCAEAADRRQTVTTKPHETTRSKATNLRVFCFVSFRVVSWFICSLWRNLAWLNLVVCVNRLLITFTARVVRSLQA